MKKYIKYDNIEYFMPFLFCNDIYIPVINKLLKEEIDPIKYVYGSIYCLWTSGRLSNFFINNLKNVENYLKRLQKYKYIPLFIFTSLKESDEILNDEFSNNLLDIAVRENAEFVVASDFLYNHIKSRYPDAKMHCSVIKAIYNFINDKDFDETRFYNEMLDKYETVVIRPEYTLDNIDKLDKLIPEISRIEIISNQHCAYNCPKHIEHYQLQELESTYTSQIIKIHNQESLEELPPDLLKKKEEFQCPKYHKTEDFRSVYFSEEQVEQLIQLGVNKIKLQGRDHTYSKLFIELYNNFFNKDISFEETKNITDNIILDMIEENKKAQLIYI